MEKLHKSLGLTGLLLASSFVLVGCDPVVGIARFMCAFDPDPVHCRQEASVEANNEKDCDNIGQKAEYAKFGSNPPQDKCYMMVAANQQDPAACDRIKGGVGSYSKEECLDGIAKTATSPDTCGKLTGQAASTCASNVSTGLQAQIQAENAKSNPDQAKLQQLQADMAKISKTLEMITNLQKTQNDMQNSAVKNLR